MSNSKTGKWGDARRQADLFEAILMVADIPATLSTKQRQAVVDFLRTRGHDDVSVNSLR